LDQVLTIESKTIVESQGETFSTKERSNPDITIQLSLGLPDLYNETIDVIDNNISP